MVIRLGLSALLLAGLLPAAKSVGVLNATGDIQVRDVFVPSSAARGMSLLAGDEVSTEQAVAQVKLRNGDMLELDRNTLVGFDQRDGKLMIYLWKGRMKFNILSSDEKSRPGICAIGIPASTTRPVAGVLTISSGNVNVDAPDGAISFDRSRVCGIGAAAPVAAWGWPTATKAAVLAAGGGAAAVVIYREVSSAGQPPAATESNPPQ